MSKQTDLQEIQRLTENAAVDARKLLIQADNLPPGTFQKMLEALCGSFEDTALQLRRLCEQQSPGTGGYKRAPCGWRRSTGDRPPAAHRGHNRRSADPGLHGSPSAAGRPNTRSLPTWKQRDNICP